MMRLNSAQSAKADRQAATARPSSVEVWDAACAMVIPLDRSPGSLGKLLPNGGFGAAMTRQSAQDCARRPAGRSQWSRPDALHAGPCAARAGVLRPRQLELKRSFAIAKRQPDAFPA